MQINYQEAMSDLRTVRDFIRWTVSQFNATELYFGHGSDNAWDEAVYLILHTLHLPIDSNPQIMDTHLTHSEKEQITHYVKRRIEERIPTPYLTREAWFAGLRFYVDERVLIPRSPIAELIEQHFAPWIADGQVDRILDLCTGSACIAIACAMAFPDAMIDAADISTAALEVAQQNIDFYQLDQQVRLIQSDLFTHLTGQVYDVIVCNPPYVDAGDMAALPAEFRHEPALGLAAGEDGLDCVIKILQQAPAHLSEEGLLIIEVGNSEQALLERFPEVPFIWPEFERGGAGVFLLTASVLREYQNYFQQRA